MNRYVTLAASVVGAGALIGSVLSQAFASSPPFHNAARSNVKHYNIKGALTITDVLRVNKNLSDYGKVYAHGGEQIWRGLLVHGGGVKTDSLSVTGALQAASGTIGGVTLQGGSINGTSLTTTGDGHVGGALAVTGKVTSNGLDAGGGGVTTSGNITATGSGSTISASGGLTAGSITTSGQISAGGLTIGGTTFAPAGSGTTGLKVSGPVDFTGSTVTGLNLGNLNLNNATLSQLNVSNGLTAGSMTAGTTSSSSNPLTLQGNGQAVALGVNSSGALTVGNVAVGTNETVGGALTVSGSSGITAPMLQSASSSSQLTLQGAPVVIKGATTLSNNTTLAGGSDLTLSASSSGTATHINAAGDADVAGTIALNIAAGTATTTETTVTYTFAKSYSSTPIVVVTPTNEPAESSSKAAPHYWVTSSTGSFTLHYEPGTAVTNGYTVHFNYMVVGQ